MHVIYRTSTTLQRAITTVVVGLVALINLPGAMAATSLDPIPMPQPCNEVVAYSIDKNRQPVVIAWQAKEPKAILVAIHGFGLHKCAYKQFARRMQQRGISTYALDVRGFGGWMQTSPPSPVSFSKTLEDLRFLVGSIRADNSNAPVFLVGESMGGAIALAFAAENPDLIEGVISSVPTNKRFKSFRTALRIGAAYILKAGGKINLNHILVERVSRNNELRRTWQADEQAKLKVTLRELLRFRKFMNDSRSLANRIEHTPVLVVQGQMDKLVKPSGTQKLFEELPTIDKQLLVLGNGEHLTFEEGQFDESVLDRVEDWIAVHKKQRTIVALNK